MTYKVVRGFKSEETDAEVCIYTLEGEKLTISKIHIEKHFENEPPKTGSAGLSTFFIHPDATVKVEVRISEVPLSHGPETMTGGGWDTTFKYNDDGGTIPKSYDEFAQMNVRSTYKYLDDGGTISKSRDDGF